MKIIAMKIINENNGINGNGGGWQWRQAKAKSAS